MKIVRKSVSVLLSLIMIVSLFTIIPFECHFFNEKQELRLIYRESRNDYIELFLSESDEINMDKDLLYTQEVLVKPEYA